MKDRHNNLTISIFCNEDSPIVGYPKLKGKAIELRAMGPALFSLWRTHLDEGKVQHRRTTRLLLRTSVQMDTLRQHTKGEMKWDMATLGRVQNFDLGIFEGNEFFGCWLQG